MLVLIIPNHLRHCTEMFAFIVTEPNINPYAYKFIHKTHALERTVRRLNKFYVNDTNKAIDDCVSVLCKLYTVVHL